MCREGEPWWHSPDAQFYTPTHLFLHVQLQTWQWVKCHNTQDTQNLISLCPFVWVFCHHAPQGQSAFLTPLASSFQGSLETPILSYYSESQLVTASIFWRITLHTLVRREGITLGISQYRFMKKLGTFHKTMIHCVLSHKLCSGV